MISRICRLVKENKHFRVKFTINSHTIELIKNNDQYKYVELIPKNGECQELVVRDEAQMLEAIAKGWTKFFKALTLSSYYEGGAGVYVDFRGDEEKLFI